VAREILAGLAARDPSRSVETLVEDGVVAEGDSRLFRTVLENLLENAWKFTRHREYARIEFGTGESDGARACFVRDNGAGFAGEYAGKLFQPFGRLHTSEEFEGTGIGLATVARIIARRGGRVWAEGAPDQWATFWFTL
jgi:light-regulated signal transduction histidine kinase (bacteriophytochrome)